ncbi:MAG: hypothetical protein HRT61_07840 [Ekhidna sp.]|nr:hypothetical protein [Ekhidna sp.]
MKTIKKALVAVFMLALCFSVEAQTGWNWGDQEDVAKENNVLYTDAYKAKNYEAAIEPLSWLLENTPDLNPSIYIQGAKIYQALAKKEEDAAKKDQYIETGLGLHDTRIKYYPDDEADILDRKSIYAYGFYSKNKAKYPYLYELYARAFELNGADMNSGNLVAYMNVIYKHRFAGGDLSDEQVIESYSAISDALEEQKGRVTGDKKKKYDKMIGNVDKILTATGVEISCTFVEEKLGPKLDEGNDLNMAKKIFGLMLKGKCLDSPLALRAAGIVQESEPTYGVAKFMAQKNAQDGQDEAAVELFKEAASLTDENSEKSEMYVSIARLQMKKGQKSASRSSARRALSFDPSYSDAYKLIGDLYMTSFDDCKQEKSQVEDRAVFIAAYNEYRKAGNSAGMKSAKAQFPSIADIFNEAREEGQSITVGCWINTTVTLERRPEN